MKITTGDILGVSDKSMVLVVEHVDTEASEIMSWKKFDSNVLTVIQLTPVVGIRVGNLRRLSATEVGEAIHLGTLEERYNSARVMGFVGDDL